MFLTYICSVKKNKTDMNTKTAMQIANLLEEQAENIKKIAKAYEEGTVSYKLYDFCLDARLWDLKEIVEEFEFNQKKLKK